MRILVPVDFHLTSFSAFLYANAIAKHLDAEITLLHIINGSFNTNEVLQYQPLLNLENSRKKQLKYFCEEYPKEEGIELEDIKTHYVVRFGIPGFTLADYANDNAYDMVIMGTRDKHGFFDKLLGSVSSLAIKMTKCPVMLIHENTKFQDLKKIVFAFDSKGDLDDTLEDYIKFNKAFKATTDFVHVQISDDDNPSVQEEEIVSDLLEDQGVPFSFKIKNIDGKEVSRALKDYCLFEKADMLVMMHRNKGLFERIFQRNESIRLAQEFHLPVLIFRED